MLFVGTAQTHTRRFQPSGGYVGISGTTTGSGIDWTSNGILHHSRRFSKKSGRPASALSVLLPIGPFCPVRSSYKLEDDPEMQHLPKGSLCTDFLIDLARVQLEMEAGLDVKPDRVDALASQVDQALEQWELLYNRGHRSTDFQTREQAKFNQAQVKAYKTTTNAMLSFLKWQISGMQARVYNKPIPQLPPGMEMEQIVAMVQGGELDRMHAGAMAVATTGKGPVVTALPFDLSQFETSDEDDPTSKSNPIRAEFTRLSKDHENLIEFGVSYGKFDALGKLRFLDEMADIHDRWNIFFTRIKLLGKINPEYVDQCQTVLSSMCLTEEDWLSVLELSHDLLRQEAEAERL
jgi:Domain of unknown function (DUF1825)